MWSENEKINLHSFDGNNRVCACACMWFNGRGKERDR